MTASAHSWGPPGGVIVECRKLCRDLGSVIKTRILHDIELMIHEREFVSLTGSSGSGKSTLLYLLGALDKPSAGSMLLDGVDAAALGDDDRAQLRLEKLGFVFQFHYLLPELTVLENVMLPMLRRGSRSWDDACARAEQVLGSMDLLELLTRRPSELSGGQQQRVSIARAVANDPRVILADEPTGNLDSHNGELVMALFERLVREEGRTVVIVTHERGFAARCSRQIVMKDGHLVSDIDQSGRAADL